MEHFEDGPFNRAHSAISEIDKAHRWNLTELERAVIRHCQAMIGNVQTSAKARHYAIQDGEKLAKETAAVL
jgi:hypothetical protein